MDFALSEEQEQLRDSARELLGRECPPARVRKTMATSEGHDPELWRLFAEQGWLGILVPESQGGAGLTLLDASVLLWELGRALVPGPFLVSSVGAVLALREGGTRAQCERWLPRLAAGETLATLAIAEGPDPQLGPQGIAVRARRDGSGWRLDGTKLFVEYAHLADLVLVACRSGPGSRQDPFAGVSLLALTGESRGVRAEPLVSVDETRRPCELRLRNVRLPTGARLEARRPGRRGGSGGACRGLARALDACAIAVAAESLGGAERALELAVDYVKVREQFGRPVGSFQAVQHMAAEAVSRLEPARALLWYAAWAFDSRPREAPLAAAMVKAHASDVYRWVSRTAVEMHGGIGFTWEHDMHLYFKRALANAAAFGDAQSHRERVAHLARF